MPPFFCLLQAFREIFDISGWRTSCDAAASGVKRHAALFKELMDHLSEGLRFYLSLQEAVKTHLQMCTDFAYTRNIQREELKHVSGRLGGAAVQLLGHVARDSALC